MKKLALYILLFSTCLSGFSQQDSITVNKKKLNTYYSIGATSYAGSIIAFNEAWYKDARVSNFIWFNDNNEWLQVDKLGHATAAYYISYAGFKAFESCNISDKKAVWLGAGLSTVYLSTIEMLDAYSLNWGFSIGDVGANTIGTALFTAQQLGWKEQRILLKMSSTPSDFAQYRPKLLGESFGEQLLKDYNGHTYWLSANINSFVKNDKLPKWLNIAVGYGGNGMVQAREGVCHDCPPNFKPFERYRQYYLSLDIDLRKIPTKSKVLNTVFEVIGYIKVPSPILEFSKHGLKGHWIYF